MEYATYIRAATVAAQYRWQGYRAAVVPGTVERYRVVLW